MVIIQKQAFSQDNIVDNHLWLLNIILGETLEEIAIYLHNRGIKFGHLPDFLVDPQMYPGNKITGLKQISEKFLQDIVSNHYFQIQSEGLPVKFVYRTLIRALFQKGMDFTPTSQITMAIGGSKSPSPLLERNRRVSPRLLIKENKDQNIKSRSKSKSKSKSKNKITPIINVNKGRKGFCAYCGAKAKFRTTGNTTHINISQTPSHHYFCSKECKNSWIFALNEEISREG